MSTDAPVLVVDLHRTAIHEAGHAVIGRAMTMACGGATIVADDESAGHSVTASWPSTTRIKALPYLPDGAVRGTSRS